MRPSTAKVVTYLVLTGLSVVAFVLTLILVEPVALKIVVAIGTGCAAVALSSVLVMMARSRAR